MGNTESSYDATIKNYYSEKNRNQYTSSRQRNGYGQGRNNRYIRENIRHDTRQNIRYNNTGHNQTNRRTRTRTRRNNTRNVSNKIYPEQSIQQIQYQQQYQIYRRPEQNTQVNYVNVQPRNHIQQNQQQVYQEQYQQQVQSPQVQQVQQQVQPQQVSSYTPYDIFNISKDDFTSGKITEDQLKKQYKKLALVYHPDKRGGDTQQFELIKSAYTELVSELRKKTKYFNTQNQPVNVDYQKNERELQVDNMLKNYEPVHIDRNNMDINKFNKVFQDFKIDTPFNDGYGNMMETSMAETSKGKFNIQYQSQVNQSMNDRQFFNNDFSQQNFNSSFENKVNNQDIDDENSRVIIYKEPESIIAKNSLNFVELGQDKINDFTSDMNSNIKCTDYKQAYYHQNTISDKVKHIDISNKASSIGKIKTERANVSYTMSEEDKQYYERVKKENEQKELQRQERLKYRDNLIGDKFHQMNRLVIKDKR